ncbi:MAG: hypothetical protein RMI91_14290 [Gemmatales bacterium]|nr:hypothetical protein [Gemmatales bacterium]MDW7995815.1 hypothetical protein [Gemmatales bacterium]
MAVLPMVASLLLQWHMAEPRVVYHLRYLELDKPQTILGDRNHLFRPVLYQFLPDSEHVLWSHESSDFRMSSWRDGKPQLTWNVAARRITAMALSSDGQYLATGHECGTVCVWQLRLRKPQRRYRDFRSPIIHVSFAQHDQWLVLASLRGTVTAPDEANVFVRDWQTNAVRSMFPRGELLREAGYGLVITPDQAHVIPRQPYYETAPLSVYHLATGKEVAQLSGNHWLGFVRDSDLAVTLDDRHQVVLSCYRTGQRHTRWAVPRGLTVMALSPDGRFIAAVDKLHGYRWEVRATQRGDLVGWVDDTRSSRVSAELLDLIRPPGKARPERPKPIAACLTADARYLILSNFRYFGLTIFEVESGIELGRIRTDHPFPRIDDLRVTPDGKYLLGRKDGFVHVWDISTLTSTR